MNFNKNKAIYLQIADYVLENILAQKWVAEDRIPSVRELAETTAVNPNTVMRTFTYLQDRDIIYNKRGIGFFVASDALHKARQLKRTDFIDHFLPHMFKTMELLGISFEELRHIYHKQEHVLDT